MNDSKSSLFQGLQPEVREALMLARRAHSDDAENWGYDAAGIHDYDPENASGCVLCLSLAKLGVPVDV